MTLLERLLSRFGYIKVIHPNGIPPFAFSTSKEGAFKLAIQSTLHANLESKSAVSDELIADLTEQVFRRASKLNELTLKEFIDKVHPPMLASRMMTYCAGVGVTAKWELDVKILAIKLGIDVYDPGDPGRKKSPGFKDLEVIIDSLKAKLPLFDLGLHRLRNLRNAMAHANFHLLRVSASESQRKAVREDLKGRVWVGKFQNNGLGEPERLAEIDDFEKIKKVGPFGWFLDASNSSLFEKVVAEFRQNLEQLNALILLHAFSFGETAAYFDRVCIRGELLTDAEITAFQKTHETHFKDVAAANRLFIGIRGLRKRS